MSELHVVSATESFTHVALRGRLDIAGAQELDLSFSSQIAARGRPAVVDLSEVEFIGSMGIGMLLAVAKALGRRGARMVLLNPQDRVADTLRGACLDQAVPIASDFDEALRLLGVAS